MFSVIIPAKNESENITRCIRSILKSVGDGTEIEIIVIDNGSEDNTVKLAQKAGAKVYVNYERNISGLRNLGASMARFEILAFLDADCEVPSGWLLNAKKNLEGECVGIVGAFPTVPDNGASWIEKVMYGHNPIYRKKVKYIGSCNMIMRKSLFNEVGGFRESAITGEDYILCESVKRLGYNIITDPVLSVIHYGYPKSLKAFFKRELWHGLGMIDLLIAGRLTLPLVWAVLNLVVLLFVVSSIFIGNFKLLVFQVIILFFLPLLAAFQRMYRSRHKSGIFKLYVVFLFYGCARTISLIKIFFVKWRVSV